MVVNRRIHRFSSLSRNWRAALLSGGRGMKLTIVMLNSLVIEFMLFSHLFKCLATVVSRSCVMSLKCPWNRIRRPTYCIPQVLHVMTYIRFELWQFTHTCECFIITMRLHFASLVNYPAVSTFTWALAGITCSMGQPIVCWLCRGSY